ncbi:type II secretion system protein [Candidatus Saccharibacteria bacterium]|nr:type II secretion system protein [Candidatus Saccharibacteria bacterium]
MRAQSRAGGFTILEVTLFLVITIGLFAIAYGAFQGQQQRTQFTQSVRDLEQKIQDVANDVATGYFPNTQDFKCVSNPLTGPTFTNATGGNTLGTNEECIFVGRVIHFGRNISGECEHPISDTSHCDEIDIYTLAGNRKKNSGALAQVDVESLAEAKPRVVRNPTAPLGPIDITDHYPTKYGIKITEVFRRGDITKAPMALGFIANFSGGSGLTVTGSYTTDIKRLAGVNLGTTQDNVISNIESNISTAPSGVAEGIIICMDGEYDNQVGAIIIGSNGSSLSTQSVFNDQAEAEGC